MPLVFFGLEFIGELLLIRSMKQTEISRENRFSDFFSLRKSTNADGLVDFNDSIVEFVRRAENRRAK